MLVLGDWSAGRVGAEVMQRSQRGMTPAPYVRAHLTLAMWGLVKGWKEDRLGVVTWSLPLHEEPSFLYLRCFS